MDSVKTRGIIARRADYGESNAMLTVYTHELGAISVCAYGVRSSKSKLKVATQVFCYADFVLSKKGGDIWRIDSAEIVESFYPICEDFEKLALGGYLMELTGEAMSERDEAVLLLLLNTLYLLAYKKLDADIAKSVFELRLAKLIGYEPCISGCTSCGSDTCEWFNFESGLVCDACRGAEAKKLKKGTIQAMGYILSADMKKLFSFEVSDEVKRELFAVCEKYLLIKTERNYKSLDYYKKIKGM